MKKVPVIEVKRAFVIGDLVKTPIGRKHHLERISPLMFKKRLNAAKKKVLYMDEAELDTLISPKYLKRLRSYNSCDWYIRTFSTIEIGVWKRAGGLPLAWTSWSVKQTGQLVKDALAHNSRLLVKRSRHAIPNMIATNIRELQKEKYLLPIVFKAGTGTNGRKGLPKLKGDIDDGCMRSIALAVSGKQRIKVYFGIPKK
jgi:hypothetical protein